jgi:putative flippase GtrA
MGLSIFPQPTGRGQRPVIFARALARIRARTEALAEPQYRRLRRLFDEFAKFAVIGIIGVPITNGVYDLLRQHVNAGPVTSATIATIVAAVVTYLGNRYWSFRNRQRTGLRRELIVFAVLNGVGLLIQDAAVAFNSYVLGLGHDKTADFIALNAGIVLAMLFRFWSYRRFVWIAPATGTAPAADAPDNDNARQDELR